MQSKLIDDLTQMATGAAQIAKGARHELDDYLKMRFEALCREYGLVAREEFEAVKEMAMRARAENEELRAQLDAFRAQGKKK